MQLVYNVLSVENVWCIIFSSVEKVILMKGLWLVESGEWRVETSIYISRRGASLIASHFGEIFAVLCPVY